MVLQAREAEYLFKIIQFNLTILIHPGQLDLFLLRRLHYNYIQIYICKKKCNNNRTSLSPFPFLEITEIVEDM